ncbi:MAG TPA: hypothetical protein VGK30_14070 [Candidatus Binatia bacterium]|jgi:hypothetical protein
MTNDPWPLIEPGADEMEWRRTQGVPPLDLIDRLRAARLEADAELARRAHEVHDLRNDLHGLRMQVAARDAEVAQLRAEIARLAASRA